MTIKEKGAMLMMGQKRSRLPDGYQEVEYIYSPGGAFIKTGYIFSEVKLKIESKFRKMNVVTQNPFGVDRGAGSRQMHGQLYSSSVYLGNSSVINIGKTFLNQDCVFEFNVYDSSAEWIINGVDYNYNGLNGWAGTTLDDYLFGTNGGNRLTYAMKGRIYYHRMYDDKSQKVRDYVPCYRVSDGVIGFFDLCGSICPLTGTPFYINAGSGVFEKGADVL